MRTALKLVVAAVVIGSAACEPAGTVTDSGPVEAEFDFASVFDGSAGQWVDMSYAYSDETIYWPTDEQGFEFEELAFGESDAGFFYSAYRFATAEHGGTHLDAPIHFSRDGQAADEIPVERLIGPAVVVDVTDHVSPDYLLTIADLEGFEAEHGRIADGSIVLIRTGWGDRWPDREAYLGTAALGPAAIPELHFPGIGAEAAQWLVDNRSIDAIGIDTPSVDYGQSTSFDTHVILYGADIPGFENVANLGRLPETGAFVVALPMKIAGGSGAPLRMVGFVPSP